MNTDPKNINPNRAPSHPELSTDTNPTTQRETPAESEPFGPVIYTYSRKQALADGIQLDVSTMAAEAGFRFPVFLTESVWRDYVKVPEGVSCQDEEGRLWDILFMLHRAIHLNKTEDNRLTFQLYVRNSDDNPAELVTLAAECGAMDFDDPRPAITVMMPNED